MKLFKTALLAASFALPLASAHAAGCLKGAVAGAAVSHIAGHHAILGAMAGCAIGHHAANKEHQQRQAAAHRANPRRQCARGCAADFARPAPSRGSHSIFIGQLMTLPRILYPIFKNHIEKPENANREFVLTLHLKSGKTLRGTMVTSKEDLKAFTFIELNLWLHKRLAERSTDGPTGEHVVIDCDELEAASIAWIS